MAGGLDLGAMHLTDLTMFRSLDSRRDHLKRLKDRFDSPHERKTWGFWPWALILFIAATFSFAVASRIIEATGGDILGARSSSSLVPLPAPAAQQARPHLTACRPSGSN